MPLPRRINTVHVEQLGGELCVYDWSRNEVHALNPTAAAVWQLCDGRTTPDQMTARLTATMNTRDVEGLVSLSLGLLTEAHLLESPIGASVDGGAVSRRRLVARLAKAAAVIPAISSIVAPTPLQAQSVSSQTFTFTGAQQTFVVPARVARLTIIASGASGGSGSSGAPGRGGRVTATVAVTAGEMLTVFVGGEGLVAGGFNGGGNGGFSTAGGGGGASEVRRGSTKLVVAGGGGGASSWPVGADGGAGGGTAAAGGLGWPGVGGGGATQTAGGAGGSPGGNPGSLGTGGVGASSVSIFGQELIGGGGGGGGFYGGGGGGAAPGHIGAGGGGGGSSYTDPAGTDLTHVPGDHVGHGQVVITWT